MDFSTIELYSLNKTILELGLRTLPFVLYIMCHKMQECHPVMCEI